MRLFRFICATTAILASIASAHAASTVVECSRAKDLKDTVRFKLDAKGRIMDWAPDQIAVASKASRFYAGLVDTSDNESTNRFIAHNGYSIVEVYTMAETIIVGINLSRGDGFYKYRDIGSGNGNHSEALRCAVIK